MTEKRFDVIHSPVTGLFVVTDDEHKEVFEGIKSYGNACRFANLLNALHDENEQLKQRNDRQAKQLDRLYRLIEEKDWRT